MATQGRTNVETYIAGAVLNRFTFATLNASGQVVAPTNGGAAEVHLQTNATAIGRPVAGASQGRVKVAAAGVIAAGALISTTAAGLAQTAATGHIILGRALEAAVAGQVITVEFFRGGNAAP